MPIIPLAITLAQMFGPGLVKWIAGDDAGTVAQRVVDTVSGITGNSADPLAAAQSLPPDKRIELTIALAKIEADREAAERQADLDAFRVEIQDRMDARARDVAMTQSGRVNYRAHIMVGGAFVTLLGCLTVILLSAWKTWSLTGEVIAMVTTIAGSCGTLLGIAFNYEFGTSRGSQAKDATIQALTRNGH